MDRKYFKIAGIVCIAASTVVFLILQHSRGELQRYTVAELNGPNNLTIDRTYYNGAPYSPNGGEQIQLNLKKIKDFAQTQTYVNLVIANHGGKILSSTIYERFNSFKQGVIVFEIARGNVQGVLTDLKSLGQGYSQSTQYQNPVVLPLFVPAGNANQLKEHRDRLLQLYAQQPKEPAAREIEKELSRLAHEIQSLESSPSHFQAPLEVATITVSFMEHHFLSLENFEGFGAGLLRGMGTVIMLVVKPVNGVITILICLLPIVVWVFVISLVIFFTLKLTSKRLSDRLD